MAEMTDIELIGYCEIHCETPRALFHSDHINRMLALAGRANCTISEGFHSMHGDMADLCKQARARLETPSQESHSQHVFPFTT